MNPRLILASASPRRVDLLLQLNLSFEQVVSPVDEPVNDLVPEAFANEAARIKAEAVYGLVRDRPDPHLVIGADTVVSIEGRVLGKPRDGEDATCMLQMLSGREHEVFTGLVVRGPTDGDERSACERTRVWMTSFSQASIAGYVESGEPLDKAGSYGIQGEGARFVERIEGDYYNVVGLPLARLCSLLEEAGYDLDRVAARTPDSCQP
ncbi:MAG: Maf family protein [Candidatus Latescibacterota bacterium]|nr:Maf family protein [Candidatus Latescibacterota bacterium]